MEFPKIVYKFFVLFLTVVSFSSCSSDDKSANEKEFVGESGIKFFGKQRAMALLEKY